MKTLKVFLGVVLSLAIITCGVSNIFAEKNAKPQMKCEERFKAMDTDKDGKVSLAEFTADKQSQPNADKHFKSKDANNDGFLTQDEFCSKSMKHGKSFGKVK